MNKTNSSKKYELPFIKVTLNGKKNETTHILRKVNNSKKMINNEVEQLLLSGFNGTLEDFNKIYRLKEIVRKKKPKFLFKFDNALLFKSDVLQGPIKLTKTKEFSFMNRSKDRMANMLTLLNNYNKKNDNNNSHSFEKNKNKATFDIKNSSTQFLEYKNKTQTNNKYINREFIINHQKEKLQKINNIRRILCLKSRNISIDDKSFQKSQKSFSNKDISIKEYEENKEPKKDNFQKVIQILKRPKKLKKSYSKKINKIFKKYIKEKNEDKQLKSILDPLRTGFKSNLKEVQKIEGKDRQNIWMKKSTANIISFGNAFQIMDDSDFYKGHKRIISVYPGIEKEANLLVPINKKRDESLIDKLENNERKIKYIVHDSEAILRIIKSKAKSIKPSKSQALFYKKKI